jgi:hypothetical protein
VVITTTASPAVGLGGSLTDTATVTGRVDPAAGATVAFKLYGPDDAGCSGPVVATSSVAYKPRGGPVSSKSFTPVKPGTYRWIASYSGDAHNDPAGGACNDAGESTLVSKAGPKITVTPSTAIKLGGTLTAKATVGNRVSPQAGASVVFDAFGPGDANCSQNAVFTSTISYPASGGAVTSQKFTPTATGAYRWTATYTGDADNNPVTSACSAAVQVSGSGKPRS